MRTLLEKWNAEAKRRGWLATEGSIADVQREARSLGWTEVPMRQSDQAVTTLRPMDRKDAAVNSLSAKYGKDAQPLHTDGAHLRNSPDIVVLACTDTSKTPTMLWRNKTRLGAVSWPPQHVQHGVFLVNSGRESFFSTAFSGGAYRYDPGCMIPCDTRARTTVNYFNDAIASAVAHSWEESGLILVIDNRQVLHARASAHNDPDRIVQRVSFRLDRSDS